MASIAAKCTMHEKKKSQIGSRWAHPLSAGRNVVVAAIIVEPTLAKNKNRRRQHQWQER